MVMRSCSQSLTYSIGLRSGQPALVPSAELGIKRFEYGTLAPGDLEQGLCSIKPRTAVDFGELCAAARFWWPLDHEQIAGQICGIAVSLDRPNVQALAAG